MVLETLLAVTRAGTEYLAKKLYAKAFRYSMMYEENRVRSLVVEELEDVVSDYD